MSFKRLMGATIIGSLFCVTASAQTYVRTVEPTPDQLDDTVRAQFIRASDVSPDEYARLLAEAEKVRGYTSVSSDTDVDTTPAYEIVDTTTTYGTVETYPVQNTPVYDGSPVYSSNGQGGYQIELYDTPITPATTTTYANTYTAPAATTYATTTSAGVISSTIASQHTVSKGDTLYNVSKRYGVKVSDLKSTNGLSSNTINIGQVLRMPSQRRSISQPYTTGSTATLVRNVEPIPFSGTYRVLPGDTLYNIAGRACVSVTEITNLNGISGETIHPGQALTMPGGHCLR